MSRPTQTQMFCKTQKELGEANELFLNLVEQGLTKEELQRNIDRRPALWARWSNWLDKLPSGEKV